MPDLSAKPFAGRTALVTGGGRGIGRACCLRLAREGARVAVNFQRNEAAAQETLGLIEADGGAGMIVGADVASPDAVRDMVEQVTERLGPIDLLINNAGVFHHVPHDETTLEIWQQTLSVNLTGTYLVTWAVKEGMISRGWGRIVNVSSISGLRPRQQCIAYAASKAGVIGFTQSLAEALAPHGIRVNAVAPGLIETDILAGVEQARLDALVGETPLGRIGQPEDIAGVVFFLLSDESGFMTGQTVVASGGRVMLG